MIFDSLLIANRGEIACRIIKTAKEMGIRSIAIYVDADKDAPFVNQADESIRLEDGGYLNGNQIIEAAKKTGAQAIHPGYGFLSENASFARKVKKENIIWIGPSPNVISVMGDKLKAKELAVKADVPTLPMTSKPNEAKKIVDTKKTEGLACACANLIWTTSIHNGCITNSETRQTRLNTGMREP